MMSCAILLLLSTLALLNLQSVLAFSLSTKPVSQLLTEKSSTIASLKDLAAKLVDITQEPYSNDVFFLRYCLANDGSDDDALLQQRLVSNLAWRSGEGKSICDSAQRALQAATADGGWNNRPVMDASPSADRILQYLTPSNILTTATSQGDLICCIRAGGINDSELMKAVTVDEMVDFFLYAREVNSCVANARSLQSDKLVCLLTANSLEGVQLVGGEAKFRSALSASSKKADPLYPNYNGPTLLLNLPKLLGALVKLFTPLFPASVRERLRFESGPLGGNTDLTQILPGRPEHDKFINDIDRLVYTTTG
ncbi:CRAL/TRIO domain containing protein [Fragilaria crotonensis]|nr:CRAL/TRIO domain containing protein [Fragilaria crotonensis]